MPGLQPAARLRFGDNAGGVDAHDLGQRMRDPGAVVAHVEIDAIERTGDHFENRLAGGGRRIGEIAPPRAGAAARLQDNRFHRLSILPELARR